MNDYMGFFRRHDEELERRCVCLLQVGVKEEGGGVSANNGQGEREFTKPTP